MRRLLLVLLLLPALVWAQPAPVIQWQHDGANVTSFKCVVDGTTPGSDLGLPSVVDGWYSSALSNCAGVMVNGTHSVVIQACNATGCTDSLAITVVKL